MVAPRTTLIVVGGLPATGKTAVAGALARRTGFAYLRIDTIEQAIVRATDLRQPLGPVGYAVGYELAAEQLRHGASVVAECVNPLRITRDSWRATGAGAGAAVLEVELVCSDRAEHRRRAETRRLDIPDLVPPSWQQIVDREYQLWDRDHVVIDTAAYSARAAAGLIYDRIRSGP
jgi:predicted kinase